MACANGNFRMELCLSNDRQFCALQLFRLRDFLYKSVFDPHLYEASM